MFLAAVTVLRKCESCLLSFSAPCLHKPNPHRLAELVLKTKKCFSQSASCYEKYRNGGLNTFGCGFGARLRKEKVTSDTSLHQLPLSNFWIH